MRMGRSRSSIEGQVRPRLSPAAAAPGRILRGYYARSAAVQSVFFFARRALRISTPHRAICGERSHFGRFALWFRARFLPRPSGTREC